MIVVHLEMWPGGDEKRKRSIGSGSISNIGGSVSRGAYEVRLFKSPEYARSAGIWKKAKFEGFRRLKLGPWDLLLLALIACISKRCDAPLPSLEEIEVMAESEAA